ncbi:hypothetical protein GCM10027288_30760 [Bordetella tumbae]
MKASLSRAWAWRRAYRTDSAHDQGPRSAARTKSVLNGPAPRPGTRQGLMMRECNEADGHQLFFEADFGNAMG